MIADDAGREARTRTIAELVDARRPNGRQTAFIEGGSGRTLSWGQIGDIVDDWAEAADIRNWQAGQRVGLLLADPLDIIGCVLAALATGVSLAPLNPDATRAELAAHVRTLGLAAVVTDSPAPNLGVFDGQQPTSPSNAALILASSGTTGAPKVVPLSERQLLHAAARIVNHHGLTAGDRGYCPLPLFHINALVVGVLSTLVAGSTLVVDRRFSARSFWPTVARHRVTWLNLVPGIIAVLGKGEQLPADVARSVRFARSASAPLAAADRERFEAHCGIGVLETYGMTEAASQITANPLTFGDRRAGSVGQPVGIELRVVDDARTPVPTGTLGNVEIRGVGVVSCYWSEADGELAARPAPGPDGWLTTGDVGRLDHDGFLYLAGRRDDLINRGGEKVYPREIEEVLLSEPDVIAAAVVGRPHPILGEEPVALVLAEPSCSDAADLVERLTRRCTLQLSRFKQPAAILVADRLPVGVTGKIRRGEVRQLLRHAIQAA